MGQAGKGLMGGQGLWKIKGAEEERGRESLKPQIVADPPGSSGAENVC